MKAWAWYTALTAGAAAVVGVVYLAKKSPPSPAMTPSPSPGPPPVTTASSSQGGGNYIVLNPDVQTQSYSQQIQDPIVVALPAGGQWVTIDGVAPSSRSNPWAFVLTTVGLVNHLFVWTDSAGAQHTSLLFFTVTSTAPQATAT